MRTSNLSIIYFLETLQIGLLVQRAAGQVAPDQEAWERWSAWLLLQAGVLEFEFADDTATDYETYDAVAQDRAAAAAAS